MKHKGKKLQRKIGKEDYDVLFDVMNDYLDTYNYTPITLFTQKVLKVKEKYF